MRDFRKIRNQLSVCPGGYIILIVAGAGPYGTHGLTFCSFHGKSIILMVAGEEPYATCGIKFCICLGEAIILIVAGEEPYGTCGITLSVCPGEGNTPDSDFIKHIHSSHTVILMSSLNVW